MEEYRKTNMDEQFAAFKPPPCPPEKQPRIATGRSNYGIRGVKSFVYHDKKIDKTDKNTDTRRYFRSAENDT